MCSLLESGQCKAWDLTVLSHWNNITLKFRCTGNIAFIKTAVAERGNFIYYWDVQLYYLRSHVIPLADKVAQQHKSAVVSHSNFVVEHKHSHKSAHFGLLPYYGGEWKSKVLIDLCICVSCHLVAVHHVATWENDRTDMLKHIWDYFLYTRIYKSCFGTTPIKRPTILSLLLVGWNRLTSKLSLLANKHTLVRKKYCHV